MFSLKTNRSSSSRNQNSHPTLNHECLLFLRIFVSASEPAAKKPLMQSEGKILLPWKNFLR